MGPGKPPSLPHFSWMDLPPTHYVVRKTIYNVNFVQSLEGSLDSAHSDFLHSAETSASGDYDQDQVHSDGRRSRPSTDTSPEIDVRETEFGFIYGAIRKAVADPETRIREGYGLCLAVLQHDPSRVHASVSAA